MAAEAKNGARTNNGEGDLRMLPGAENVAGDLEMVAGADDDGADDDGADDDASYAADSVSGSEIHVSLPSSAQEILEAIMEMENRTTQSNFTMHRFPQHLKAIGGQNDCYVVPGVVAIGPYHHGLPRLQPMEEIKYATVSAMCSYMDLSVHEVYEKIRAVAGDARRCYDSWLVACLSDAQFATMMFLDSCFLLSFFAGDKLLPGCGPSFGPSLVKDIFLLENQIPWLVLEALMELTPSDMRRHIIDSVSTMGRNITYEWKVPVWIMRVLMNCGCVPEQNTDTNESSSILDRLIMSLQGFKPPHILGLLRFILICNMPPQKRNGTFSSSGATSSVTISAVDLAQKGVKLAVSTAGWFADMNVQKTSFFGELSLSPLLLDETRASWLVNLAALEAVEASAAVSWDSDGSVVSSYLSLLAMLMEREEDVHELRRSGVLRSRFSNTQTLVFFKGISQHLPLGYNYCNTLADVEDYMRHRPLRVAFHKFLYNNYKIVGAVLSIAGVLVGIFKALYSLKHT